MAMNSKKKTRSGGQASFPEFHNFYVEARDLEAYKKTGKFQEGTLIVKRVDPGS